MGSLKVTESGVKNIRQTNKQCKATVLLAHLKYHAGTKNHLWHFHGPFKSSHFSGLQHFSSWIVIPIKRNTTVISITWTFVMDSLSCTPHCPSLDKVRGEQRYKAWRDARVWVGLLCNVHLTCAVEGVGGLNVNFFYKNGYLSFSTRTR